MLRRLILVALLVSAQATTAVNAQQPGVEGLVATPEQADKLVAWTGEFSMARFDVKTFTMLGGGQVQAARNASEPK